MEQMPILALLLQGLPEAMILYYIASFLTRFNIKLRFFLPLGLFHAGSSYLLRIWLPFPLHSLVLIALMSLVLKFLFELQFSRALIGALGALFALLMAETVAIPLISYLTQMSLEELWQHTWLRTFLAWPHLLLMWGLTALAWKKGWNDSLWRDDAMHQGL